jgi:hypothetical protein
MWAYTMLQPECTRGLHTPYCMSQQGSHCRRPHKLLYTACIMLLLSEAKGKPVPAFKAAASQQKSVQSQPECNAAQCTPLLSTCAVTNLGRNVRSTACESAAQLLSLTRHVQVVHVYACACYATILCTRCRTEAMISIQAHALLETWPCP